MNYIPAPLYFHGSKVSWYRPLTLVELLKIKQAFPHAKLVAGNTEVGIETKFKKMEYNILVYTNDVPELKGARFEGTK
jgi:xanthine dehydrogenase/oxidase